MRPWLLVLVAACGRDGGSTAGPTAKVHTGVPLSTVVAHDPGGATIDQELADAVGDAIVVIDDQALISVEYSGTPTTILTTLSPGAGGELSIFSPVPDASPPIVIGTLQIQPTGSIAADRYDVELGCLVVHETNLAQAIDVSSRCAGSDVNIDVLVHAYAGTASTGYLAGRISLANGGGVLAGPWNTTTGGVPVMLAGVSPALDWVLISDGLPFAAQPIQDPAPVWTGLVVDSAIVHATVAQPQTAQITTRTIAGAPAQIAFSAADFMAPISPSLALDSPTQLHWAAGASGADALDLHLAWPAVVWDVVLPPDATDIVLPDAFPQTGAPQTAVLRYLDSSTAASFADVLAAGLRTDTILTLPADGQVLESDATGFAP